MEDEQLYKVMEKGGLFTTDKAVLLGVTKKEAEDYIKERHSGILMGDGFTFYISEM